MQEHVHQVCLLEQVGIKYFLWQYFLYLCSKNIFSITIHFQAVYTVFKGSCNNAYSYAAHYAGLYQDESFSCFSERVAYLHVNSSIVLAASLKVG